MDIEQNSSLLRLLEDEFMCPIYKMPIHNPVITPVGITYEKEALEGWLDVNGIEPQSKKPLDKASLIQNLALKGLVSKIYKEVPKLERSLTGKDEVIANLTEEVAQLRSELEYERQKCQENEDLMECTLEKTKKIRKIQENVISQKEMEKAKLKQKVKEITKLKMELYQVLTKQKIQNGEIADLKNATIRLEHELRESRDKLTENKKQLQKARESWILLTKFQFGIARESRNKQMHRQFIIRYVCENMSQITKQFQQNQLSTQALQEMINKGVDSLIEKKHALMLSNLTTEYQKYSLQKSMIEARNKINIQRYLNKSKRKDNEDNKFKYWYELININDATGYRLEIIPYSIPPTEEQCAIDWSETIRLVCNQIDEAKWQVLMNNIGKFQRLVSLQFKSCTIQNLTEVQLTKLPKLKQLTISEWGTLNEQTERELERYRLSHPQVSVQFHREYNL